MTNESILNLYGKYVDFLADMLGKDCEVVLHDLTTPDMSIVKIRNGQWSGRAVGGPLTDLALKILQNKELLLNHDYISNYKAINTKGEIFKSSTFFIKNSKKEVIGLLCVNININYILEIESYIKGYVNIEHNPLKEIGDYTESETSSDINLFESNSRGLAISEQLQSTIEAVMESQLFEKMNLTKKIYSQMSVQEKIDLINGLYKDGFFLLKGAVSFFCEKFEVSEPTVYRYLRKAKK